MILQVYEIIKTCIKVASKYFCFYPNSSIICITYKKIPLLTFVKVLHLEIHLYVVLNISIYIHTSVPHQAFPQSWRNWAITASSILVLRRKYFGWCLLKTWRRSNFQWEMIISPLFSLRASFLDNWESPFHISKAKEHNPISNLQVVFFLFFFFAFFSQLVLQYHAPSGMFFHI